MNIALTNFTPDTQIHITNFEDVKKEITEISNTYKDIVLTDENEKEIKEIRAKLNKVKKAIDDRRKEKEKELKAIYEPLKKESDELIAIIDIAEKNIAKQLDEKKAKEQELKAVEILEYWNSKESKYKDSINYDLAFNPSWLNKTYEMKKVKEDIDHIFSKVEQDMECIEYSVKDEKIRNTVVYVYNMNIDKPNVLSIAMEEFKKLSNKQDKPLSVNTEPVNIEKVTPAEKDERKYFEFKIFATMEEAIKVKQFINSLGLKVERVDK